MRALRVSTRRCVSPFCGRAQTRVLQVACEAAAGRPQYHAPCLYGKGWFARSGTLSCLSRCLPCKGWHRVLDLPSLVAIPAMIEELTYVLLLPRAHRVWRRQSVDASGQGRVPPLPADVLVANGFQRRLSYARRGRGGLAGWGAGGYTYVASTSTAAARDGGWQRC